MLHHVLPPPPHRKNQLLSLTRHGIKTHRPSFFKPEKLPETKIKRKLRPEQQYMCPLLKYHDRFLRWRAWVWTYPIRCCFVCHKCQSYIPVGFILGLLYSISLFPCFFFFYYCLFIFSACLSSSLFCCCSVILFGLFGVMLILFVLAGLGRKTQITITNQTATPTAALTTPISQTFCIYLVCFSLSDFFTPCTKPFSVCPCTFYSD